jgi:hypothetical protein
MGGLLRTESRPSPIYNLNSTFRPKNDIETLSLNVGMYSFTVSNFITPRLFTTDVLTGKLDLVSVSLTVERLTPI